MLVFGTSDGGSIPPEGALKVSLSKKQRSCLRNFQGRLFNIMNIKWYVYIVQCSDESLYTGFTNNLTRRVTEHNNGIGAKSLRGKRPVRLVYSESFNTGSEARKREYAIKQWKRENKLKLIFKNQKGA